MAHPNAPILRQNALSGQGAGHGSPGTSFLNRTVERLATEHNIPPERIRNHANFPHDEELASKFDEGWDKFCDIIEGDIEEIAASCVSPWEWLFAIPRALWEKVSELPKPVVIGLPIVLIVGVLLWFVVKPMVFGGALPLPSFGTGGEPTPLAQPTVQLIQPEGLPTAEATVKIVKTATPRATLTPPAGLQKKSTPVPESPAPNTGGAISGCLKSLNWTTLTATFASGSPVSLTAVNPPSIGVWTKTGNQKPHWGPMRDILLCQDFQSSGVEPLE